MIKRVADQLFRWFCHPDFYPDIKGDLEELFSDHLLEKKKLAQLHYFIDVLLLFRPSLIRPITQNSIIKDTGMFRNYFKVSLRNLVRHKMFTAINVVGLAIGLASFLLINKYIQFEKSYDSFHMEADQLYRASYVRVKNGMDGDKDAMSAYPVGKTLEELLPEVINHTVTKKFDPMLMRYGDVALNEEGLISADSNFFELFTYTVLQGDKATMLNEPNNVVLTQSRAKAYFGDSDPIGKTIEIVSDWKLSLKVTGVIQDLPDNTHYNFDMIMSDKTLAGAQDYQQWLWNNYYVYIKMREGINLDEIEVKANKALDSYLNHVDRGGGWDKNGTRLDIHPVQDIYLKSDFDFEPQVLGSMKVVNFLMIISVFILIIAWVNYINLSTARAMERAKEVGLRKVIGAFKRQLIFQFLFEAMLINVIGTIVALVLAEITIPYFNQLVGKQVIDHVWSDSSLLRLAVVFAIIGTFASGFYPALVLSEFKPITVLKGKFNLSKRGVALRKGLVVAQFAASLILIASTFTIYQQVNYMLGKDLGISVDQVINITVPDSDPKNEEEQLAHANKLQAFKEVLRAHHTIEAVGATSNMPGGAAADINSTTTRMKIPGVSEGVDGTTYAAYNDEGFLDALDVLLLAGRNFDRNRKVDTSAVLVNESFLRRMNLPNYDEVVDQKLQLNSSTGPHEYKIVGVVEDFNRTTLKTRVEPSVYFAWFEADDLAIKLNASNVQDGIDHIKNTWDDFYAGAPFTFSFLDERFAALYDQDRKFGDTFLVFALLAAFVAILGLFGLSSFLSIQRSKEVGVRKVLGASNGQIIMLFYRHFFVLIGIASLIGFPLVYYLMDSWLDNYAYRIAFPWSFLIISTVLLMAFAFFTVGYQTAKVASLNPAQTLKYE